MEDPHFDAFQRYFFHRIYIHPSVRSFVHSKSIVILAASGLRTLHTFLMHFFLCVGIWIFFTIPPCKWYALVCDRLLKLFDAIFTLIRALDDLICDRTYVHRVNTGVDGLMSVRKYTYFGRWTAVKMQTFSIRFVCRFIRDWHSTCHTATECLWMCTLRQALVQRQQWSHVYASISFKFFCFFFFFSNVQSLSHNWHSWLECVRSMPMRRRKEVEWKKKKKQRVMQKIN